MMPVPPGAGIGVTLNMAVVTELRTDHIVIE
jgi:hypothetical protein